MRFDTRRMTGRVAVSLVFAIFAYLGLLFGGNLVLGPARGPNAFSSSSKDGQPLQLSARDVVRGVLAADRKLAPKYANHDSADALPTALPAADRPLNGATSLSLSSTAAFLAPGAKAYDSRGPPAIAA